MRSVLLLLVFILSLSIQVHAAFDLNDVIEDSTCEKFRKEIDNWPKYASNNDVMLCKSLQEAYIPPATGAKSIETKTDVKALSPLPQNSEAYSFSGHIDLQNLCRHFNSRVGVYLSPDERAIFYYLMFLETDGINYSAGLTDHWVTKILSMQLGAGSQIATSLMWYTFSALQQPKVYGWTALKNGLFGRSTNDIPGLKALLKQYAPVFESSRFRACVP